MQKAGCKYRDAFEKQVLDQLVLISLEKVDNEQKEVVIIAIVCCSHDLITTAAKKVQAYPAWLDD